MVLLILILAGASLISLVASRIIRNICYDKLAARDYDFFKLSEYEAPFAPVDLAEGEFDGRLFREKFPKQWLIAFILKIFSVMCLIAATVILFSGSAA